MFKNADIEIYRLVVGPLYNNSYILRCKQTGQALLVDAANEAARLLEACRRLGADIALETHGHWDHIQAVAEAREAGIKVGIREEDAPMLAEMGYDFLLEDDTTIGVGRQRVRVIHTPGHTPGSCCFFVEGAKVLFSGDTLFPGGPGATHFPGGDFETIMASIEQRLFRSLPSSTLVLPGHGSPTTIAAEMPSLEEWRQRGY